VLCPVANSTSPRSSIFRLSTKKLTSTLNDIIYYSFIVIIIIAHSRYSRFIVIVWAFGGPPPLQRHFRPPPRLCKWRPARHRATVDFFTVINLSRVWHVRRIYSPIFICQPSDICQDRRRSRGGGSPAPARSRYVGRGVAADSLRQF
jgi:hypothetical protein